MMSHNHHEPQSPEVAPQLPEQAPPSPDYVPSPEHPPSPDYVPGPEYPEYVAPTDDEVPIEDQPLPADALPITLSPGYVADSDPEEDLKEDPTEYPVDGGDDDEARKTIRHHPPMAASTEALIAEFAYAPTPPSPPPSPLLPWSSPLPHIPSLPLVVLSPPLPLPSPPTHTSPTYAEAPLGYRAAMIRSRAASPSTHHPLLARFSAPASGFEVGESSAAAAARQAGHALTSREVNERVTDATQIQDAHELHMRDEDAQDDRALLRAQAWARFESRSQAMEAQIQALQRDVSVLQR
ncbi:hypothetical protein Tco_0616198 [Tanacetum coccineum]